MAQIKKVIIPVAGLGTRFLPLSKVFPKELWPLVDKPIIQYIIEEVIASGIKEIIFVIRPGKEIILDYFKEGLKSKKVLQSKYKNHFKKELENLEKISKNISFSHVFQKEPLGDGQAILQAENLIKKKPCAVLFDDDIVESKVPCLKQLIKFFRKYQRPVMALAKVPQESFKFYGLVGGERIAKRVYRVKRIVEKPSVREAPSNLAIIGKRIITPKVFDYLKKNPLSKRGEIGLTETLGEMIKDGQEVYGYEVEGKWLECGNKLAYLKSNFYLSLKHSQFGPGLRKYLKKI